MPAWKRAESPTTPRPAGSVPRARRSNSPILALQRQAGNRAVTSVVARDADDRQVTDDRSGKSIRRLRVSGLTGGFSDWAIVLVPSNLPAAGKPVDILLHLHGHAMEGEEVGWEGTGHGEGKTNTEADDVDLYRIDQQLAASGRPMIGILPQGNRASDFNQGKGKGFDADAYVAQVFKRLGSMGVWKAAPTPGGVTMSGHSGADAPLAEMLNSDLGPEKLSALFLFDTMYPGAGFATRIWNAIERRLDQDLTTIGAIGADGKLSAEARRAQWVHEHGFRVYNVHGGFYEPSSEHLSTQFKKWLDGNAKVVGTAGSAVFQAIAANIQIISGKGGHFGIMSTDDHLKTALGMLPGQNGSSAAPAPAPAPRQQSAPVPAPAAPTAPVRIPATTPVRGPAPAAPTTIPAAPTTAQAPAPAPAAAGGAKTKAEQVAAAVTQVHDLVRAAAAPLVGTPAADDIVGILTQQIIKKKPDSSAKLRKAKPDHPALPLYAVLYGTDVVAALKTIETQSEEVRNKKNKVVASKAQVVATTRRKLFQSILGALITDVTAGSAVAAPTKPLDEAAQIAEEKKLVGDVLPFLDAKKPWTAVRVGVITEFGGLVSGTRTALTRANDYYGKLQKAQFLNVTHNTKVHPDLNAAFARAEAKINERLATMQPAQVTQVKAAIQEVLGRKTWSANLRENRNSPHRLSDHSFGFAIDIDSPRNPNISNRGGLDAVRDVTGGGNPRPGSTVGKSMADVEVTADRLKTLSDQYKAAMASDASLAPVVLRLANEARARVKPALPALPATAGADLVAALVLGDKAARNKALQKALWPEGSAAGAKLPAEIADMENRLNVVGRAFRESFKDKARTKKVNVDTEGNRGTVAAGGFLNLPALLVGALASSDAGNLRWLGTENQDFMHFELQPRRALYTDAAPVGPPPADQSHTAAH